jgi:hypothetical protein
VSGATCAAALRVHCAQTQLICGSAVRSACAVKMSAGGNSRITAWRGLMTSKGLSGAAPVLEGYGLSCEHDSRPAVVVRARTHTSTRAQRCLRSVHTQLAQLSYPPAPFQTRPPFQHRYGRETLLLIASACLFDWGTFLNNELDKLIIGQLVSPKLQKSPWVIQLEAFFVVMIIVGTILTMIISVARGANNTHHLYHHIDNQPFYPELGLIFVFTGYINPTGTCTFQQYVHSANILGFACHYWSLSNLCWYRTATWSF